MFSRRTASGGAEAQARSAAANTNTAEFRQVILPHLDGAYNLARYLTRDPVLAEDIVQDAFVRAFRAFDQFRGGSARAWLFTIVRNCCRTAQASARNYGGLVVHENNLGDDDASLVEQEPDDAPSPEEHAIRANEIARLREAVEAMPEPFREAIVLRELEDLSYAEIAQITGVPVGTVMSRLSRGRTILATILLPQPDSNGQSERNAR